MSEEYILLVMPHEKYNIDKILGYLEHISNQKTLKDIKSGAIFNKNPDWHFPEDRPGDKETIEAFYEITKKHSENNEKLENYHFFRAEILDTERLEKDLSLIQETYPELLYECYNKIPQETE